MKKRTEFSKKLLVLDYLVFMILVVLATIKPEVDFTTIIVAWVAQLGISSAAYYWKAKSENRSKLPFKVVENLPQDIRDEINLTEIIVAIISAE